MASVKSVNMSLTISQIIFQVFGLWRPDSLTGFLKHLYDFYSFISWMLIIGSYIIAQAGDLVQVWGNLPEMTGTMFLLFTNLALGCKAFYVTWRKNVIMEMLAESNEELLRESREKCKKIVQSFDAETTRQLFLYFGLSLVTIICWTASAEKKQLPLRAWYPYDTSRTPAYQLTFVLHQFIGVILAASINISLDTLVTSLVSMCRCRLRLLSMSLATLCDELDVADDSLDTLITSLVYMCRCRLRVISVSLVSLCDGPDIADDGRLTASSDKTVRDRLRDCVVRHKAVLAQVRRLQHCFSTPLLAQFAVSMVIICVTAYQAAFDSTSLVRKISMLAYLADMMLQVFIYCYQGTLLVEESDAVSTAAYQCPWYTCSIPVRRSLLLVMTRTRLSPKLAAGGFTQLSLATFTAIIKASYSFFTVLKQVETK